MSKRIAYFEYGRVYPQPEGAPFVDGGAPVVPESEYTPPRLHICSVLLALWCIAFAALHGGAYIAVLQYPLEPVDHVWWTIPLGVLMALVLWGVTLALYKCARRHR